MSIYKLPKVLINYLVSFINPRDAYYLKITCKHLYAKVTNYIVTYENAKYLKLKDLKFNFLEKKFLIINNEFFDGLSCYDYKVVKMLKASCLEVEEIFVDYLFPDFQELLLNVINPFKLKINFNDSHHFQCAEFLHNLLKNPESKLRYLKIDNIINQRILLAKHNWQCNVNLRTLKLINLDLKLINFKCLPASLYYLKINFHNNDFNKIIDLSHLVNLNTLILSITFNNTNICINVFKNLRKYEYVNVTEEYFELILLPPQLKFDK